MELDMTKGSPFKLISKFIISVILGNLFQHLYSMVDTIIVGQFVGVDALAAVGATGSITFLIMGFTMGLTTGFTVMTAQRFGANDLEGMRKSIASAIVLSVIVTIVMTAASIIFMDPLLHIMNTPEDIMDMSKEYLLIICAGIFCSVLYNIQASILRAIGNSVVPLVLLVIASFANIILDYVLIVYGQMGVAGAAYATIISQGLSGVCCLIYIIKAVPLLHVSKHHFTLDRDCVWNQMAVGIPMALQFSITAVGTILVQAALNLLGSTMVAAYSVSVKVEQLATQPFGAMGVTMATYCAQNRGVNDIGRIKKGVRVANTMSAIYAIGVYGVVYMLLPYIVRLFVSENFETVLQCVRTYIGVCGTCFVFMGMIFIYRNALQGCGFGLVPMLGGVVEMIARGVVAFVAARMLSYAGVCASNNAAWAGAAIFLLICYHFIMKKMEVGKN